jgi:L-aminopeptidase/D-esterase-like protein
MLDGDTIFALATNEIKGDINLIGTIASEVMSRAITNAIVSAKSCSGLYSYNEI